MQSPSKEVTILNHTLERLQNTPFSAQKQIVSEIRQVITKIYGKNSPEFNNITKFKIGALQLAQKNIEALVWAQWEYFQKRQLAETLHHYINELKKKYQAK